ncbi:oligosaccharide flippase family protein [Roseomonas rosulenta]|uniref:oligosaccharide flippase family protein n=1 Tax=Roseomonas rosulenta TaxID=2748667 RepID=UPI0018E04AE8|nr:oligosaccharide flippase family protein [Roseomonas rosulenta]
MGEPSILARTARGAGWVIAWRIATRLLGLFSMLVLARLLVPEDFGLVALATSLAFAIDSCLLIGVEDQIIRAQTPSRELYDTAFTMTVIRGVFVGVVVALAAPWTASFFGDDRLETILYALGATFAASGFANIGAVDFRRNLEFHLEFRLMTLPRIVSVVVTVGAAFFIQSHWALIAGFIVYRAGVLAMSYAMHPHRPRFSLTAWRDLIGVSIWTWGIGVAIVLRDRSDAVLIGRLQGPTGVGIFTAGSELATIPTAEVAIAASRAVMPGLADLRRSSGQQQEREAVLRILGLMLLLSLPAGFGISLLAGPTVVASLGPRWIEAVPVVVIIGLAGAFAPFDTVGSGWLRARAELRALLAIILISVFLRVGLLFVLTIWMGLPGAAAAVALSMLIEPALTFTMSAHRLGIGGREVWEAIQRPLAAVAVMATILVLSGIGWTAPPPDGWTALRILATAIPIGALVYGATVIVLWRATGKREGAEADAWSVLRRVARTILRSRAAPWQPAGQNQDANALVRNEGSMNADRWRRP